MSSAVPSKVRAFKTAAALRAWLARNHGKSGELWLRLYKKSSGIRSVDYATALDEALCFGWIDGLKKSYDDDSWVQRFTPRGPRSKWSKINTAHVQRLIAARRMAPPGQREIDRAREDGRWQAAYDSPRNAKPPAAFMKALRKNTAAHAFYRTLNRTNLYAIAYRLQTAKRPQTQLRWTERILAMLERGERFH